MGIFKKALHSKIDVFVKFESAINLQIQGQIKKKKWIPSIWVTWTICMHFHKNLGRSRLGHLTSVEFLLSSFCQQCNNHVDYNE